MIETKVSGYEILRTVVGSGLHGIAIEGLDDHDEMGIYIEPPEVVLGLAPALDHVVTRTQPEGVRSGPGDTDLVQYSLRKFMRLAVQGNPTILLPLYAPTDKVLKIDPIGAALRNVRTSIVSRRAGHRFLGYMDSQIARFEGRKKMPTNRPELTERYGYDTKFASHAVRLGLQGVELLTSGEIKLPIPEPDRGLVRSVKEGEWSKQAVIDYVRNLREELRSIVDDGPEIALPEEPDYELINRWMIAAHLQAWGLHA